MRPSEGCGSSTPIWAKHLKPSNKQMMRSRIITSFSQSCGLKREGQGGVQPLLHFSGGYPLMFYRKVCLCLQRKTGFIHDLDVVQPAEKGAVDSAIEESG